LEGQQPENPFSVESKAITAIKQALAAPVQPESLADIGAAYEGIYAAQKEELARALAQPAPVQEPVAFPDLPLTPYQRSDGAPLWDTYHLHAYALRYAKLLTAPPAAQPAPVQEPVARVIDNGTPEGATEWTPFTNRVEPLKTGDLLYTIPPAQPAPVQDCFWKREGYKECPAAQRQWVGLTDEQKLSLEIQGGKSDVMLAELVEGWLKEKNNG